MDKTKIEEYLEKFPTEIREPIMALNNDQKWALFIALTLDKEMYFNEIKKVFNGNANTIDINLKTLVASGLIAKKVKKIADVKNQEKTYYHATEFGKNFLYTLCDIGLPKPQVTVHNPTLNDIEQYKYKLMVNKNPQKNYILNRLPKLEMKNYVKSTDYFETIKVNHQNPNKINKAEV